MKIKIYSCLLMIMAILSFMILSIISCKKENNSNTKWTITDIERNIYNVVTIGTQVWMVENLMTTRYKDSTSIANVTSNTGWENIITGAYRWYDNDSWTYKNTYGALYNWYAVSTGKLCPTGWHVPADVEWATLTEFLGGENIAGAKLKETGTTHWISPNTTQAGNIGFKALPAGICDETGSFMYLGEWSFFWSSTEEQGLGRSFAWTMVNSDSSLLGGVYSRNAGFSVRCVKD
jgi:uncharacterized protein (TIGR02145 family)